ncbi:MAG: carbamoyl phosphate synthase large subunit [Rhodospirillaceae bacterium]|nr:carbamoyl phosphate synthase large subunit [Rhodospirillaceae bacterium]|tara:strand:+ start:13186 stop:16473 length:3288 start_codon:yes stop_codon:yes gene_type:complete
MPKRSDISSIMIVGAGPIIIGQACEFDYSGTQAVKALREEGYRIILINSNPATIMTDPSMADATYIEPITPEIVAKIIELERPDAILPTMGGQTALNTCLTLERNGTLKKLGIEMIGAKADVIDKAEDRLQFREAMSNIGLESPISILVKNREMAEEGLLKVGLPAIIRPSFTLAGTGGGVAYNQDEYFEIIEGGLTASPTSEVLVEESVLGWKEYEMEVVRDQADNCIIVCSIENIDPMGVHTGDSITVAPALTLSDKEFQIMRNASVACLREIGVDTGGSNVQFAVNPSNGRMVVIEMNPRVSRSSALASKATGFPIAKIAAKLAVGYTLDELDNDITGVTPASFEPTIDYIVTKIPRFTFEKFPGTKPLLTTSMKSVGEVMAIGRTFTESLQKALRSLETGLTGLNEIEIPNSHLSEKNSTYDIDSVRAALGHPTPERILIIAQAIRLGVSLNEIQRVTHYDPWFLEQLECLIKTENKIRTSGLPQDHDGLLYIKQMGFSDARLAELSNQSESQVTNLRNALSVKPVYKRIDTCAAEFPSQTPYMYSTYEGYIGQPGECEADPSEKPKIIVLGGGPNRIGQGIEFDYCCVHAIFALHEAGYETIMINCNPETVSTDYDTSDRLYFEPLTTEDVIEICQLEQKSGSLKGVIVQFGGQTPLKLASALHENGINILGTSPDAIDLAEDRERFQQILKKLNLKQPKNGLAKSAEEAISVAEKLSFPLLIRPSYVLGGRAMEIVYDMEGVIRYISEAVKVSGDSPVLLDSFLQEAIEVDVDALADGSGDIYIAGIMEHIEEAGIHSGDSACSLPPFTLDSLVLNEIERQTKVLAKALKVVGLMNIQFAVKDENIYIIEVNPRASRTVPFVAKATGVQLAKLAARLMVNQLLSEFGLGEHGIPRAPVSSHVAIKEAVFPFARFPGVDTILGPEMKSTGEVMGLDKDFGHAFAKSQLASGVKIPISGNVFISVRDRDKLNALILAERLIELGFKIFATRGTAAALEKNHIPVKIVNKVLEGRPHIVDSMTNDEIDLVINTTEGNQSIADSYSLRRTALTQNIPYYTTIAGANAALLVIQSMNSGGLEVAPLQAYFNSGI